jgi:hypothetical protein
MRPYFQAALSGKLIKKTDKKTEAARLERVQERNREVLHWLEWNIGRLNDNNMGVLVYLDVIAETPNNPAYWEMLETELGERDDQLQYLFEVLNVIAADDIPLDCTTWELKPRF